MIAGLLAEGDGWVRPHGFDPLTMAERRGRPPRSWTRSARTVVTLSGAGGLVLHPEEALTVEQALQATTHGGALALGVQDEAGSLALGMLADLAVLSADPVAAVQHRLAQVCVLAQR